jgi:hypothetical protein
MKKLLFILAAVLCLSCVAFAQAGDAKKPAKSDAKTEAPKTAQLTGCLASSGSGYTLTNGRHKDAVTVTSSEDLKPHVGHQVRMKGTWSEDKKSYKAESVAMVSDTCPAPKPTAAKSSKKKADATPKP